MSDDHSISRRRFLATASLSLLAPLIPIGCYQDQGDRIGWLALGRTLTGLDEEQLLMTGRKFRERHGQGRRALIDTLPSLEGFNWRNDGLQLQTAGDWESSLEDRVRQQYRQGQTDEVDGWVLSEMELTILALAARVKG